LPLLHDLLDGLYGRIDPGDGQPMFHQRTRAIRVQDLQGELQGYRLAYGETGTSDQQDAEQRPSGIAQPGQQAKVAQRLGQQRLRIIDRHYRWIGLIDLRQRLAQDRFEFLGRKLSRIGNAERCGQQPVQAQGARNEVVDPDDAVSRTFTTRECHVQRDRLAHTGSSGDRYQRRQFPHVTFQEIHRLQLRVSKEGVRHRRLTLGSRWAVLVIDVDVHAAPEFET
jgi:hypothetical protein